MKLRLEKLCSRFEGLFSVFSLFFNSSSFFLFVFDLLFELTHMGEFYNLKGRQTTTLYLHESVRLASIHQKQIYQLRKLKVKK